ncbi:MAG TPA: amidohydrolase family protein [Thermoanaerobaculia bacterium]
MRFQAIVLALLIPAGIACQTDPSRGESGDHAPVPSAAVDATIRDHHVHLLSPGLVRDWKGLGVPFSRPDDAYTSYATIRSARGRVNDAVLVPMAHFYGNEEFRMGLKLTLEEERARARGENDHVAAEARTAGDGTVAFCSVDYLRPYAWEEIRRCHSELGSPGLKLHLASAGTDLRSEKHLDLLTEIAKWAADERVTLLIHFDPQRRGINVDDVERFIQRVIEPHPTLVSVIPHLGGSGGYGRWTQSVFGVFSDWAARNPDHRIYFDISAAVLESESEGVPASTEEELTLFAASLRRAGFDRLLFATDYPLTTADRYATFLRNRAGLTEEELARLMANRLP